MNSYAFFSAGLEREARDALSSEDRTKHQLEGLFTRLAEILETHFRHEEQGGYLKEALRRAPHLITRTDALLEQHQSLSEQVETLRLLAHSGVESPAWWSRVESDFQKFASQLLNHEHAENNVIQEAFTEDIGTGD